MADPPKLAARLVALLDEIQSSKNQLRNASTDAYGYMMYTPGLPESEWQKRYDEEDKKLEEAFEVLQKHHAELRAELGNLAKELAATAHEKSVKWIPVLSLYTGWKCEEDQIAASKAEAMLLLEILKSNQSEPPNLNDAEKNIIDALGEKTMRGGQLAKLAGYPFNSNFKSTLSSLKRRGILGNNGGGYFLVRLSGQRSGLT